MKWLSFSSSAQTVLLVTAAVTGLTELALDLHKVFMLELGLSLFTIPLKLNSHVLYEVAGKLLVDFSLAEFLYWVIISLSSFFFLNERKYQFQDTKTRCS